MNKVTTIIGCVFLCFNVNGQKTIIHEDQKMDGSVKDLVDSNRVVVDISMIQKYQNFKFDGNNLSFIDAYRKLSAYGKAEYFSKYRLSNFDNEAMDSINSQYSEYIVEISDSDIEKFRSIKSKINNALDKDKIADSFYEY